MAGMEITIKFPEIELQLTRIANALEKEFSGGDGNFIPTPSMFFVPTDQETVTTKRKLRKAKDITMLKMVGYFQLSEPEEDSGVTQRNLVVNDVDTSQVLFQETLPGNALKSGEVKLAVGLNCKAVLVDQDEAGNKSDPFEATFTVSDVMKPPQPGMTGFVPTGQVDES